MTPPERAPDFDPDDTGTPPRCCLIVGWLRASPGVVPADFASGYALYQHAIKSGLAPMLAPANTIETQACLLAWAKIVGAVGGELWVVERDGGGYDAQSTVAYKAWLDAAGDSYDVVRERRRSGPWSWWERQMTSDD